MKLCTSRKMTIGVINLYHITVSEFFHYFFLVGITKKKDMLLLIY